MVIANDLRPDLSLHPEGEGGGVPLTPLTPPMSQAASRDTHNDGLSMVIAHCRPRPLLSLRVAYKFSIVAETKRFIGHSRF